jgi:hemolysin activation/secretion protein
MWINGFLELRNAEEYRNGAENFDDRLRVGRIRLNYNRGGDTFFLSTVLRFSKGFDVLGASQEGSEPLSRTDGDPEFLKVSADATYAQTIYGGLSVQFSAMGQKSANGLLSAEEFAVGGSRFGRAYDFAEITGEDGAAGSIEIRFNPEDIDPLEFLQFYTFFDMGAVWNRASTGTFRRHSLSSVGAGVRMNFPYSIQTSLEAAQPVTRPVSTSGDSKEPRFFFTLSAGF